LCGAIFLKKNEEKRCRVLRTPACFTGKNTAASEGHAGVLNAKKFRHLLLGDELWCFSVFVAFFILTMLILLFWLLAA
jgi:hypothetical protein